MAVFEVTLRGYYGGTDETDHLVKWIRANSMEALTLWFSKVGVTHLVESIVEMGPESDYYTPGELDVIVEPGYFQAFNSTVGSWRGDVERALAVDFRRDDVVLTESQAAALDVAFAGEPVKVKCRELLSRFDAFGQSVYFVFTGCEGVDYEGDCTSGF